MADKPRQPNRPSALGDERPSHPTRQAALLLLGVTMLIVVLALLSSSGKI